MTKVDQFLNKEYEKKCQFYGYDFVHDKLLDFKP